MKYRVIEALETEYRGKSDGPVDVSWGTAEDELGVMTCVAQILAHAREPQSKRFATLKSTTHAIRIELVSDPTPPWEG